MLSELPETELDTLCDILLKEWPNSIPVSKNEFSNSKKVKLTVKKTLTRDLNCDCQAINTLRTCYDWKKKKPSLEMQILYNEKNIQSGIFILIHKSVSTMQTVYLSHKSTS